MCVTWFIQYVWHDSFNWLIQRGCQQGWNDSFNTCDMTHSICWHGSCNMCNMTHSICMTWLIQYVWHDSFNLGGVKKGEMTHPHAWRDFLICVTWLIHTCDMNRPHVWHDSINSCDMTHSICGTRLIYTCDSTHPCVCVCVWHDSSYTCDMTHPTRVTWLILHVWHDSSYTCDMTDSYVRHDSFIHVTWLILYVWYDWFIFREMAHSYVGHDLLICATWLIHTCTTIQVSDVTHSRIHYNLYVWYDSFTHTIIYMCDMTHSHIQQFMRVTCKGSWVWHDSFLSVTWLIHTCDMTHWICLTRLIHMCHVTHAHMWYDSFICVTWLIHMCDMTLSYVWHDSLIMSINALSSN